MKKAFLILMLLAVSVGLFAQDDDAPPPPAKTFTFNSTVEFLFIPFQMVSRSGIIDPNEAAVRDFIAAETGVDKTLEGYEVDNIKDAELRKQYEDKDFISFTGTGIAFGRSAGDAHNMAATYNLSGGTTNGLFGFGVTVRARAGAVEVATAPHLWWEPMTGLRIRVGDGAIGLDASPGATNAAWGNDWALGLPGFVRAGLDGGGVSARFVSGDIGFSISIPGLPQPGDASANYQTIAGSQGGAQIFNFANGNNDLMYRLMRTQIEVGYNIAGIGNVRFAYFGPNGGGLSLAGFSIRPATTVPSLNTDEKDNDLTLVNNAPGQITAFTGASVQTANVGSSPRFQIAFGLKAVTGLTLDIGARFAPATTPKSVLTWHEMIYDTAKGEFVPSYSWLGFNEKDEMWTLTPPVNFGISAGYAVSSDINVGLRADVSVGGGLVINRSAHKEFEVALKDGKGNPVRNLFIQGTEIKFAPNVWTQLYGTVKLPGVLNGMTVGFQFSLQSFGATKIKVGGTDKEVTYGLLTGAPALRYDPEGTTGFTGGIRIGGGAYAQIPVAVSGGNIRIGAFFRTGEVHGIKEDVVFTMPISWSITFP